MSKITNDCLTRSGNRMLYSCTHMATVGFKGWKMGKCSGCSTAAKRTHNFGKFWT